MRRRRSATQTGFELLPWFSICSIMTSCATSKKTLLPRISKTWRQRSPSRLKFEGRKRWHDADAFMADIVAKRLVRHLERAGYVVKKRPPALGGGDNPGSAVSRASAPLPPAAE